jgi:enoyl-CoA hydratase/carnithine racemase
MTGSSLSGGDMLKCKLATHFIDVDGIEPLLDNLKTADWERADGTSILNAILANYCEENIDVHSDLEPMFPDIGRLFKGDTVGDIFSNLEADNSEWAQETLKQLHKACPISVVVALAHIRASQDKSFDDVMAAEYKLSHFFMKHPDFYEGVRAALIDKDHSPQWSSDYKDLESFTYQKILDSYQDCDLAL